MEATPLSLYPWGKIGRSDWSSQEEAGGHPSAIRR